MRLLKRVLYSIAAAACANLFTLITFFTLDLKTSVPGWAQALLYVGLLAAEIIILIRPQKTPGVTGRLRTLSNGCELLCIFLISAFATTLFQLYTLLLTIGRMLKQTGADGLVVFSVWLLGALLAIAAESAIFWGGMLRLYFTSVQLGIKHRVLGVLFAWVPVLNLYCLWKIIHICRTEVDFEVQKQELDAVRAENEQCKTKYPLLMVHGVFFRDFKYFNYWGRVPAELMKNGATVYYGQQQSAASVDDAAKELAERIREIVKQTGCEKVNIIAHSKGGLDCRAAITHHDAAQYVATLTTVNTPHYGCLFAEHILAKMPHKIYMFIARSYNKALKAAGDAAPDFVAAITDLTFSACARRNETTPNMPGVLYESVMSYCEKAQSGRFPLNVSYPIVKHYDGKNDGLVAVDSAKWGDRFTLLAPKGQRGISHGDMIDLNRENVDGFDVREFYVSVVSDLKIRGY